MASHSIKVGLLGASKIAPSAIIAPAALRNNVIIHAVAAQNIEKAQHYAKAHQIEHAFGNYQELIECPDIDLVYCALPPSYHAEWVIKALQSGKHVLCEKPFAMNSDEAKQMVDMAKQCDRVLIEAFHYCYHPLFTYILDLVKRNHIGAITHIDAEFSVAIPYQAGELRYNPKLGGGALMDLGCYPLHWARMITGFEPEINKTRPHMHKTGVDLANHVELIFENKTTAHISYTMNCPPDSFIATLDIYGEHGHITINNPIAPDKGHSISVHPVDAKTPYQEDRSTTYHHQLGAVLEAINHDKSALTGGLDAINTMKAIDAIKKHADSLNK